MGRIDADGFLHVLGRIGDRINMGGETVAPAEIEAAIRRIPGVQACLCFGLPHDTLGETIAAAVVPDEGAPLRPEDIRAEAARHLPRAKVPAKIFLMEKLPLDANGKINRRHLASTLAAKLSHSSGPDDVALDPFEAWMLELFRSMLRRPDLGPAENFFDAGGTSLDATETMLRIEQHLGVTVHLPLLFDAPTATGLALAIRERFPDMTIRLFPWRWQQPDPPLPAMHR
ncbi:phosphopantetheine-binding protein [Gemmobacter lanyuensis]